MNEDINTYEDGFRLAKYNEHITNLENLFKSVQIKGNYEQYRLAPCFMLFNFIDLLRSVAILDIRHMVASGNIIIRTMFEILIDFLYCETNRKNLYLRFGEYENVNRVLLYTCASSEIKSKLDNEIYDKDILLRCEEFKNKYNIKKQKQLYNWSGLSLFERVNIVSKSVPEILDLYLIVYKVNCGYTHTYATTICEYATLSNQEIHMNYENKYSKDKLLLIKEVNSLVEIFYDKFKSNYENKSLSNIVF